MTDTLRAMALMVLAMAAFAGGDALIKVATRTVPPGQVIMAIGVLGGVLFAVAAKARGLPILDRAIYDRAVLIRNTGEAVAAACFVTALSLVPLGLATMIFQSTPIVVTAGAALILGERVGLWRWSAVLAGLFGMMLVLRPGMAGFDANALWALVAVFGMATRDLSTRFVPKHIANLQLSIWGFATLIPTGGLLMALFGGVVWPSMLTWGVIVAASLLTMVGYFSITASLRLGEVSAVMPYRYTRILFALVLAWLFFGESIDLIALTGVMILIASGLVVLWREGRARAH